MPYGEQIYAGVGNRTAAMKYDCGDKLEDVTACIRKNLKVDKNNNNISKRLKNYRKYGIYASFEGKTKIQCQEEKE